MRNGNIPSVKDIERYCGSSFHEIDDHSTSIQVFKSWWKKSMAPLRFKGSVDICFFFTKASLCFAFLKIKILWF